ncbi:unnamed protein product, partial [Urochloa humidicola]
SLSLSLSPPTSLPAAGRLPVFILRVMTAGRRGCAAAAATLMLGGARLGEEATGRHLLCGLHSPAPSSAGSLASSRKPARATVAGTEEQRPCAPRRRRTSRGRRWRGGSSARGDGHPRRHLRLRRLRSSMPDASVPAGARAGEGGGAACAPVGGVNAVVDLSSAFPSRILAASPSLGMELVRATPSPPSSSGAAAPSPPRSLELPLLSPLAGLNPSPPELPQSSTRRAGEASGGGVCSASSLRRECEVVGATCRPRACGGRLFSSASRSGAGGIRFGRGWGSVPRCSRSIH